MQSHQIDQLTRQYTVQCGITARNAHLLDSNVLRQDASGKLLMFSLALLSQHVDIEVILKAVSFSEAAWYRAVEQVP